MPIKDIKQIVKKSIQYIDVSYLHCALQVFGEIPGIRGLLFHSIFSDFGELECEQILPQQRITVEKFRIIVEYFLEHNYIFLKYDDLKKDLNPQGKYIYVTFDDGYYNNIKILPVIEDCKVPIHLFVTTGNIISQKKYWWDVIYHERRIQGASLREIKLELGRIKRLRGDEIEKYIKEEFGCDAFRPRSDIDRPLSAEELRMLSKHELVTIGNHTQTHSVFTTLSSEELKREIVEAGREITEITGYEPAGFAYPDGDYRLRDIKLLDSLGIDFAFSCDARINRVPADLEGDKRLIIGRYSMSGHSDVIWQGKIVRAGISPFLKTQQFIHKWSH